MGFWATRLPPSPIGKAFLGNSVASKPHREGVDGQVGCPVSPSGRRRRASRLPCVAIGKASPGKSVAPCRLREGVHGPPGCLRFPSRWRSRATRLPAIHGPQDTIGHSLPSGRMDQALGRPRVACTRLVTCRSWATRLPPNPFWKALAGNSVALDPRPQDTSSQGEGDPDRNGPTLRIRRRRKSSSTPDRAVIPMQNRERTGCAGPMHPRRRTAALRPITRVPRHPRESVAAPGCAHGRMPARTRAAVDAGPRGA
jgi:hypothetical protein